MNTDEILNIEEKESNLFDQDLKEKVAFYPCCGNDFSEPLKILKGRVNRVFFCDIKSAYHDRFSQFKMSDEYPKGIDAFFLCCDAQEALEFLGQIDVFFYRCDSNGEGGSKVCVFSEDYFLRIVSKMPQGNGIIVTDGSNCWKNTFAKIIRPQGTRRYGWRVKPIAENPIKTRRGDLWVLSVKYEGKG